MRSVGEYMRDQKERKELLLMNYLEDKRAQMFFDEVQEQAGLPRRKL